MAEINKPICLSVYGNSGYGDCVFDPGKLKGAFQVPLDFVITKQDALNLRQFLQQKVLSSIEQRIFPYHGFVSLTDNTEDTQIETTDYGTKIPTRDGDYDLTLRFINGGVMLLQQIQKNAGPGKAFIFYDDKGNLIGYKTPEGLMGIPTLFVALPWRMATGSTSAIYNLRFIFESFYLNYGNLGYIGGLGFNLQDVKGLQDVTLELINLAGNVATVQAFTTISGANLFSQYASNLASPNAWEAFDEAGNVIDITGVTQNTGSKGWNFTFDNVDFSAADKAYLSLKEPAVIAAPPISVNRFDTSIPLEIEAPGS